MLPSADNLYGDVDFLFPQNLALAHSAKTNTSFFFSDHNITTLDQQPNSPELNLRDSMEDNASAVPEAEPIRAILH